MGSFDKFVASAIITGAGGGGGGCGGDTEEECWIGSCGTANVSFSLWLRMMMEVMMMGNRSWLRNSITVATAIAISISIIVEFLLFAEFL